MITTSWVSDLDSYAAGPQGIFVQLSESIDRLRATKVADDQRDQDEGGSRGYSWAKSQASARQLKRLSDARLPDHDWSFGVGDTAFSAAEEFVFIIDAEAAVRDDAAEFWQALLGDSWQEITTSAFIQGFALGADELWCEVKDAL